MTRTVHARDSLSAIAARGRATPQTRGPNFIREGRRIAIPGQIDNFDAPAAGDGSANARIAPTLKAETLWQGRLGAAVANALHHLLAAFGPGTRVVTSVDGGTLKRLERIGAPEAWHAGRWRPRPGELAGVQAPIWQASWSGRDGWDDSPNARAAAFVG